jgi:hypothetical protein
MPGHTLVSVHCYAGDKNQVLDQLPYHRRLGHNIVIMSPEDAPVNIVGMDCRTGGLAEWCGWKSLERQFNHMRQLLDEPYSWYLMNDSDSLCIQSDIPEYLYEDDNVLWSNVEYNLTTDHGDLHRQYGTPRGYGSFPHVGFTPPFFMGKSVLRRLLAMESEFPKDGDQILPCIAWQMMVLAVMANVEYRTFPTAPGFRSSFAAYPHSDMHSNGFPVDGASQMVAAVEGGSVMLHSIKHRDVLERVSRARERFVRSEGQLA